MRRIAAIVTVVLLASAAYGTPGPEARRVDGERSKTARQGSPRSRIPALREIPPEVLGPPVRTRASAGSGDTAWYGGTTWMPDSMRWEAIRDSVWTFDTGVGSSINTGQNPSKPVGYHETMEGWYSKVGLEGVFLDVSNFRRSSTCAITGSHSMWAGVTPDEAAGSCFATGQGYGNGWNLTLTKSFVYPGTGSVTLAYAYAVDSEPGFDYAYVAVDTTGQSRSWPFNGYATVRTYTGSAAGVDSVPLVPGYSLRTTPGPVTIAFVAHSDASYSDEDGLYDSVCGLLAVDDIHLTGAIRDTSDFEFDDNGWSLALNPGVSDFVHVALSDSLPPPDVSGPCSMQDSVLVFFNETFQHPYNDNFAISPWIDLKRHGDMGRPGVVLSYNVYSDIYFHWCPPEFVDIFLRWYPGVCPTSGAIIRTPFRTEFGAYNYTGYSSDGFCTPPGQPIVHDLTDLIDAGAEQIQVAIQLGHFPICPFGATTYGIGNDSPWFDNIRLGVYGIQVGVPETPVPPVTRLQAATPNPFRASTSIAFTLERPGPASLTILDVAGRRVRTLASADFSEGSHRAEWNGLDDLGRSVPNGLYFYRLTAAGFSESRKLVVLK